MSALARRASPSVRNALRAVSGGSADTTTRASLHRILLLVGSEDEVRLRVHLLGVDPTLEVDAVRDADTAFAGIVAGRYEAVFIDAGLRGVQVFALLERCRKAGPGIPLIVLTDPAHPVPQDPRQLGASDVIEKASICVPVLERSLHYASERRTATAELLALRRQCEAITRGCNDGIWDWNLKTGALYLSPRLKEQLGWTDEALPSTAETWLALAHPEDLPDLQAAIEAHLRGMSADMSVEMRMRHRNGAWHWVFLRGMAQLGETGQMERIAGSQTDIAERKAREADTVRHALCDELTGLANRTLLIDRIDHAIKRVQRERDYGFAVLYLDLDGFQDISDVGRDVGNGVLQEVATRLLQTVRSIDCVSRVGNDEFVVLLDRCPRLSDAHGVARNLERALLAPSDLLEGRGFGVSIGACMVTEASVTAEQVLSDADRSMCATKVARRSGQAVQLVTAARVVRSSLESELRVALDTHAIDVHYQPIVDVALRHVVGYEALARWSDRRGESVSPAVFVPMIEQLGLSRQLGRVVLEKACRWAAGRIDAFSVSVNISPTHVADAAFADDIEDALAKSGLAPSRLRLEFTEHAALIVDDRVLGAVQRIVAHGVRIDLDDFGTGYSAMELLLRLPVSAIKIDRSLVRGIDTNGRKLCMLRHIVDLAHALNATVTAEGIETENEYRSVSTTAVDLLQGFLFGRPAPHTSWADTT